MSTSGATRMSKLALMVAGTTLKATPPSSLVRFTEVTAPSFKWGLDCSLRQGGEQQVTQGSLASSSSSVALPP